MTVERDIFAWAGGRFRERDVGRGHRLPYSVEFRDDDQDRQALAAAHGFVRNVHASNVYLQRQVDALPPRAPVLVGFAIRPLAGAPEAEAYAEADRAVFDREAVTAQWRERTIGAPLYQPDLGLVAVAPDGTLAGFCVLHRFKDRGAGVAVLDIELDRTAARAAYDAVGFK